MVWVGDRGEGDRGAVAVEFALLFPLLFFLLFGTLVFGWRLWERQAGQSTARDAARLAGLGIASIDTYRHDVVCLGERNGLHAGTLTEVDIAFLSGDTLQPTGTAAYGGYVQVSLTYESALGAFPLISHDDGTFVSSGVSRIEQLPSSGNHGNQTITVSGESCQ